MPSANPITSTILALARPSAFVRRAVKHDVAFEFEKNQELLKVYPDRSLPADRLKNFEDLAWERTHKIREALFVAFFSTVIAVVGRGCRHDARRDHWDTEQRDSCDSSSHRCRYYPGCHARFLGLGDSVIQGADPSGKGESMAGSSSILARDIYFCLVRRLDVVAQSNSALLTDASSSLRCACGAAKRGR